MDELPVLNQTTILPSIRKRIPLNFVGRAKGSELVNVKNMVRLSGDTLRPKKLRIRQTFSEVQFDITKFTSEVALDPEYGHLICTDSQKANDGFREDDPKRLPSSDLIALRYIQLARDDGTPPERLRYIWRYSIINPVTNSVIESLGVSKVHGQEAVFAKDSDGFKELLATPNRKGVCFLLRDYCSTFGYKDFVSVSVWYHSEKGTYSMMFELVAT